jgi:hypothetical protein
MSQKDAEDRDRLVAGRFLLNLEYPCSWKVLAREHIIGFSKISEIAKRFLSQDEDEFKN